MLKTITLAATIALGTIGVASANDDFDKAEYGTLTASSSQDLGNIYASANWARVRTMYRVSPTVGLPDDFAAAEYGH